MTTESMGWPPARTTRRRLATTSLKLCQQEVKS